MPDSISQIRVITFFTVPASPAFFSACPRWNSTQRLKSASVEKMPLYASAACS